MLPYSRGFFMDKVDNYGIVKTETVFGFEPTSHGNNMNDSLNSTEPLEWIITRGNFVPRSLQGPKSAETSRRLKEKSKPATKSSKKKRKGSSKSKRQGKGKSKKCIFKVIRKNSKKNRRGSNRTPKPQKKYMMPLILGLLAAKSLLIPIALKFLAFLSAKGLMMGFFSTVLASVLSLKGMFEHSHGYQNRKEDTKTQVEIIHVPSKSEDHVYYDEHYKKGDLVPVLVHENGDLL